MKRLISSGVFLLVAGATGCELVAGINDKVLSNTPTDATAGEGAAVDVTETHPDASADPSTDAESGVETSVSPQDADASLDSGSVDAGDASGDASRDAGTTDPSAPCSMQAVYLLCDDFDTESTVSQDWQYQDLTSDGGSMAFFTGAYTSPPRSLQVTSPATTGAQQVALGATVGTLDTSFRLAFDLRLDVDSLLGVPTTAVAQVVGKRTGAIMQVNYLVHPGSAELQSYLSLDGGGAPLSITLPPPPLRSWTRIVIAYDTGTGMTVYEDGQRIGSDPTAVGGPPKVTVLQMGMVYQVPPGTGAIRFELDNIVFGGL
jgi:hypothetical protein